MNRKLLTQSEKDYLACVADSITHISFIERAYTDRAITMFKLWLYGRTQKSVGAEFGVSGTMAGFILKAARMSIERQSHTLGMRLF